MALNFPTDLTNITPVGADRLLIADFSDANNAHTVLASALKDYVLALTDSQIFVGNVSNIATGVAMSGEATIANTGAVTLSNSAVIAKLLTGFTSGAGVITAADSILEAIQKLDGNITIESLWD
ncbi:MAG: hypothetical protein KKC50_08195, partial [Candidatus Omnitrophica bacterium]|nr:hypothetical protein [Candidatus Omnitrophota bacterium]